MMNRRVFVLALLVGLSLLIAFWLRPAGVVVRYEDLVWKNDVYFHAGQPFTGLATAAHGDGKPKGEYPFVAGRFHGVVREWWENGVQAVETHFEEGKRHGNNTYWDQTGRLTKEQVYDHDHSVSEKVYPHEK
jgi:antitoxin component YwqK of YwqJK toxin-antitoxin module